MGISERGEVRFRDANHIIDNVGGLVNCIRAELVLQGTCDFIRVLHPAFVLPIQPLAFVRGATINAPLYSPRTIASS